MGSVMAARKSNAASALNRVGVWETGAVNQSNAANSRRTATAIQSPSPPDMKPRTSPISLCGSNAPYIERTTITTESIASAIAID